MADTYSQIYIQAVFAVKGRVSLIHPTWEERLYQYITGIVQNQKQKMIAISGMPDHVHLLIGIKPSFCLSDLIREVKKSTNDFIKDNGLTKYKFAWQEGYGAFSYSHSQLKDVISYILNQKKHHRQKTFKEEYLEFLEKFNIGFEDKYLFNWIE